MDNLKDEISICASECSGIGDAVCSLYTAVAAADAGYNVKLYSKHTPWFSRLNEGDVEVKDLEVARYDRLDVGLDITTDYNQQLDNGRGVISRKDWYARTLSSHLGFQITARKPKINLKVTNKRIDNDNYVILFPYSHWQGREWPISHWKYLTYQLEENGISTIVIGADGGQLHDHFNSCPCVWYYPHGNDWESWVVDAMIGSKVVVGNDSGMAHLSALHSVPTIAVHAQMPAKFLWSHTEVQSVMPNTECAGCSFQHRNGFRDICSTSCSALYSISSDEVLIKIINQVRI